MLVLLIVLLVLWLILAVVGFAIEGLMWLAIIGIILFVVGSGAFDVAINGAALADETWSRPARLTLLHAAFSGGGVLGAIGAGALVEGGMSFRLVYPVLAVSLVAVAFLAEASFAEAFFAEAFFAEAFLAEAFLAAAISRPPPCATPPGASAPRVDPPSASIRAGSSLAWRRRRCG